MYKQHRDRCIAVACWNAGSTCIDVIGHGWLSIRTVGFPFRIRRLPHEIAGAAFRSRYYRQRKHMLEVQSALLPRDLVMRDFSRWNCSGRTQKLIRTVMILVHFILISEHATFAYLPRFRLIFTILEKQREEQPLSSLVSPFAFYWAILYQPHMAFICATRWPAATSSTCSEALYHVAFGPESHLAKGASL